jgi:hypothetical protein
VNTNAATKSPRKTKSDSPYEIQGGMLNALTADQDLFAAELEFGPSQA